ncbi:MAG: arginine--tRNA ligase [Pseudomonadota bacterium]
MKFFREEAAKLICEANAHVGAGAAVGAGSFNLAADDVMSLFSTPPDADMGDISVPCFKLAGALKLNPKDAALKLSEKILGSLDKKSCISGVKNVGPYVNFFINTEKLYELCAKFDPSQQRKKNKKTVVIDYSSPNIAKPLAFHHIRSTAIGNIIGNIFEHCGYNVARINYLGDWGTQFGKLITAFKKYGDDKKLEKDGIKHLLDIYVSYHKDENDELEKQARSWFQKMEAGDKEALSYWKRFRDISIKEFDRVYKRLGVSFTNIEGESFYNGKTDKIIEDVDKKIGTKESEGAIIADLSKYDMPPMLLKKTDGATLYATRDLTAAIDRWNRFKFDESLYVVAHQQELHFKQLFKVMELMGIDWYSKCKHIPFGLLHLADAKMSTREGNVIFMEDVLDRAVELAEKAIEEKNPELQNKKEVAEMVGVGAVIFGDITKRRIQNITFKWEEVLSFEGETAPYVQYTHARACSILGKAGFKTSAAVKHYVPEGLELEVLKMIYSMDDKIEEARVEHEPFILARYVLDLSKVFNKYYYQEKIIDVEDENKRNAKLHIVNKAKETIKACLGIMGVRSPDRM